MTTTLGAIDLPFDEAIAFLRQKANVTSENYTDVWGKANVKSFTVAGASTQALVDDFRREVAKALEQGTSLQEFRKSFDAIVEKHGWAHTGKPGFRSRIIFETNLGMAYSAGRYAQQTEPDTLAAFPFWQYVHSGAQHPRLEHKSWDGKVLRADDPWWGAHYPPNGWRCGCRVRPLSARGLARQGKSGPDEAPPVSYVEHTNRKTGEVYRTPKGIDPGFDYNVGQEWTGRAPQIPANATLKPKTTLSARPVPAPVQKPASPTPPRDPDAELVSVLPAAPPTIGMPIPQPPMALPKPKQAIAKGVPEAPAASPSPAPAPPAPVALASEPGAIAVKTEADLGTADRLLHQDFKAWGRRLTAEESWGLELYKGSGYRLMNQHLRGQSDGSSYMPSIRALDAALSRAKLKRPVTVHRGVPLGTAWDDLQVGQTIRDPGFLSTSLSPRTAESFSSAGVHVEIRLPKGYAGGAYVNRIPDVKHPEFEFLIRPGAPFRVIERSGSRIVVEPVRGGRRRSPKLD